MRHYFNAEIAKKYGVAEAVLVQHIYYWVCRNRKNNKNLHDGRYWTYNSIASYTEIFPYLTEHKIRNAFKKLKSEGMLIMANYSANPFDKTIWYTITDKAESILSKDCIQQNTDTEKTSNRTANTNKSNMEKTANGGSEFNKSSITNINKANINHIVNSANFEKFWAAYPKKERKLEAQEAFLAINPDNTLLEKMLKTISAFAKTDRWQTENGRYIPLAVNWLNQKRWEDKLPETKPKGFGNFNQRQYDESFYESLDLTSVLW